MIWRSMGLFVRLSTRMMLTVASIFKGPGVSAFASAPPVVELTYRTPRPKASGPTVRCQCPLRA